MSDKLDNYREETKPLFRLLRTEAFRFIITRYDHYSLITKLKEDLDKQFPERPTFSVDARSLDYRSLVDTYYELGRGFYFIENFEVILDKPEIYSGLNQRRDKLAKYPIAIIALISMVHDELYARQIMQKMPDLWSFRSLLLDLKVETRQLAEMEKSDIIFARGLLKPGKSNLDKNAYASKKEQLYRLLNRVGPKLLHEHELAIRMYTQIAQLYSDLGNYQKAIEYFIKTKEINSLIKDSAGLAATYNNLGEVFRKMGEWDKALDYYLKDKKISIKINDLSGLATAYNNIGLIHDNKGDWDQAIKYYNKSKQLRYKLKDTSGQANTYNNLGEVYRKIGDLERAHEYLLKAEMISSEFGNQKDLATIYNNIGLVLSGKAEWDKALSYYLKSEQMYSEIGNKNGLASAYNNIGGIYEAKGEWDKALEYYEKSEKIRFEIGDKAGFATTYNNIGIVYDNKGEWDKALEYHLKSKKIRVEVGDKAGLATTYNNLAAIYFKKGDIKQAIAFFRRSEKICLELGYDQGLAFIYFNMGMAFQSKGDRTSGDKFIILAGFIAILKEMKHELLQMANVLEPLVKRIGEQEFMETGKRLFEERIGSLKRGSKQENL